MRAFELYAVLLVLIGIVVINHTTTTRKQIVIDFSRAICATMFCSIFFFFISIVKYLNKLLCVLFVTIKIFVFIYVFKIKYWLDCL